MKRIDFWLLAVITVVSTACLSASGKTVYVSPEGAGDRSGVDEANACAGVAAGYAAATANDTIRLLGGTYLMDGSVTPMCTIENTSTKTNLLFVGDAEHPENVILDGGGNDVGFFDVAAVVTFRGITFRNVVSADTKHRAIYPTRGTEISLENCRFLCITNTAGPGAACYVSYSCYLDARHCTFEKCATPTQDGGAVAAQAGNVGRKIVMEDCTFRDCAAKNGGALSLPWKVLDCKFYGCSASLYGGAIKGSISDNGVVSGSTFVGNWCKTEEGSTADNGAGAVCTGYGIEIVDCEFRTNISYTGSCGAIRSTSGFPIVRRCKFYGNQAYGPSNHGGSGAASSVKAYYDCYFEGNYAANAGGGAVGANVVDAVISNCTFVGNSTSAFGGAVYGTKSTTIVDCSFVTNLSSSTASCIYWKNGTNLVDRCSFLGNVASATDSGSECVVFSQLGKNMAARQVVRNSLFAGNMSVKKGPSVASCGGDTGCTPSMQEFLFENCTFAQNRVDFKSTQYGAIRCTGYVICATNCLFYGNCQSNGALNNFGSYGTSHFGACASEDGLLTDEHSVTLERSPFVSLGSGYGFDFVFGDYRLKGLHGVCVDAGLQLPWMTADAKDLARNARVYGAAPDLGCYERAPKVGLMLLLR